MAVLRRVFAGPDEGHEKFTVAAFTLCLSLAAELWMRFCFFPDVAFAASDDSLRYEPTQRSTVQQVGLIFPKQSKHHCVCRVLVS